MSLHVWLEAKSPPILGGKRQGFVQFPSQIPAIFHYIILITYT